MTDLRTYHQPTLQARFRRGVKNVAAHWQLYVLLIPAIVIIALFHYKPLYGIQLAWKNMRLGQTIEQARWVGWRNFERYFNSAWFWPTIKNTFIIGVATQLTFPLPIMLALLLHNCVSPRMKKVSQTVTYIPSLVSIVVTMSLVSIFCDGETGLINLVRKMMGDDAIGFYSHDKWVLPMYVVSGIWKTTGTNAVIFLAALASIDLELVEASTIDGCSKLKRIFYIDLPIIMPTIITMLILSLGRWFAVQTDKLLLLQTPLNLMASEATGTYTYKMGIANTQYGISTAIGLFVNVINLIMLVSVNFISKKVSETSLF